MYFVIEHNVRPDGIVNVSETSRSTFALALSFFFDRASKDAVNEAFVSSHLLLVDETLNVVRAEHIDGLYETPEPEETVNDGDTAVE